MPLKFSHSVKIKFKQFDSTNLLKWFANAILVVGTIINALGYYPLGPIVLSVGSVFWLIVAIQWRENSLIAINSFMILTTIISIIYVTWFKTLL